jgi:hypothetical protein
VKPGHVSLAYGRYYGLGALEPVGWRDDQYFVSELFEFLERSPKPGDNAVHGRQKDLRHECDSHARSGTGQATQDMDVF